MILNSLFAKLVDKKAFWGGINAEFTLESEDYAKIEKEVEETVEALGSNNGLDIVFFDSSGSSSSGNSQSDQGMAESM